MITQQSKILMWRLLVPFLSAVVAALLLIVNSGCSRAHSESSTGETAPRREGERVYLGEASSLRRRLLFETVREDTGVVAQRFMGQIVPAPQRHARVFAPFPGRVIELHAQLGQEVQAGDPLVTLHSPEAVALRGEFLSAARSLDVAERNAARQRDLLAHRVAAARDVEEAEAELAAARADYEAAAGQLALMGLSPKEVAAGGGTTHLVVRAPKSGRVIELDVSVGEVIQDEGEPLGAVADLSVLWLVAEVPERDLAQFAGAGLGAGSVEASVSAYPGEVFRGELVSLGDVVSSETRTAELRIALPNADGRLKPGMFASVEIAGAARRGLSVPATALVQRGSETLVYEELAPGVLEARAVRLGASQHTGSGERVFITDGLRAGAKILTSNGVLLP